MKFIIYNISPMSVKWMKSEGKEVNKSVREICTSIFNCGSSSTRKGSFGYPFSCWFGKNWWSWNSLNCTGNLENVMVGTTVSKLQHFLLVKILEGWKR